VLYSFADQEIVVPGPPDPCLPGTQRWSSSSRELLGQIIDMKDVDGWNAPPPPQI